MQFFTPELYIQFNSPNDDEADDAHEKWEQASVAYKKKLEDLLKLAPKNVRNLTELSLHDQVVVSKPIEYLIRQPEFMLPTFVSRVAIVTLKDSDAFRSLIYFLHYAIEVRPAPTEWPFATSPEHWLYDEFEVMEPRMRFYRHRVLLSSGVELVIPFADVIIHEYSLASVAATV